MNFLLGRILMIISIALLEISYFGTSILVLTHKANNAFEPLYPTNFRNPHKFFWLVKQFHVLMG